ncbi:MAG: RNA polymerase sigma factor [Candidatus Limnocylindria bacterium]
MEGSPLELVRRAQAGDREAFGVLVERHASETYRLAAAIVGEADARDLAQESFAAAWTQLPRLRDPDAFAPWLRRICVNRCRNWLRSASRRGRPASLDADDGLADHLTDARRDFRGAVEARALLEPAFDRLSPDQRAILALHYSMGYSIAEAADALDVRAGTAKSRLNAGLRVLRAAIGPSEVDPEPEVVS